MKKVVLLMIICSAVIGCATRAGGYKAFGNDMDKIKGKSINEAYIFNIGYLRDVKPSQIKKLANGHEIWIYQTSPDEKDKACKSSVEVDLKTGKIVDTSFSGSQCLRAI